MAVPDRPDIETQPNINKAWQWGVNTCNAPNVGYSMDSDKRNGVTVYSDYYGMDVTYYDCSSFVFFALKNGGFDMGQNNAWSTPYMKAWFESHGFHEIDPAGEWKPGDILLDPDWGASGHTEMVYSGGIGQGVTMGAHTNAVALPDQVSINTGPTSYYPGWRYHGGIWRYGAGGTGEGYGVSIYVISAILGNWYLESGINAGRYENGEVIDLFNPEIYGGYGLGQWTDVPHTTTHRRTKLCAWLNANGYELDDPYGQLTYFMESKEWIPKEPWLAEYPDFDSFINSTSTDIDELCDVYYNCWEGGGSGSGPVRQGYAHKVYEYLRRHGNDTGLSWSTGNFSNTEQQRLDNAVLCYQWLSIAGGGGGGGYHYRGKMPVWLMIKYI